MTHLTETTKPTSAKQIKRVWHLIDAKDKIVGRLATEIARLLTGKNKATYSPNIDMGDYVVVVNSALIRFTGSKLSTKTYTRYSGYPSGLKTITAGSMLEKNPNQVLNLAVSGMLPKNKLRDPRLGRLYIFPDERHSYQEKFEKKA